MRTSNKLLWGLLAVILVSITVVLGAAKYYAESNAKATKSTATEVPAPPAAPASPQAPGR